MTTELPRVEWIFFAALEKRSAAERAAYLDDACGGDMELRGRVERLLSAHPRLGDFLQGNAAQLAATVDRPLAEGAGSVIGPYKLLEKIGEGGFGAVFMAHQQHPIRRPVAVKIIKPGADSQQVIARFEAERQALALMDHPRGRGHPPLGGGKVTERWGAPQSTSAPPGPSTNTSAVPGFSAGTPISIGSLRNCPASIAA